MKDRREDGDRRLPAALTRLPFVLPPQTPFDGKEVNR